MPPSGVQSKVDTPLVRDSSFPPFASRPGDAELRVRAPVRPRVGEPASVVGQAGVERDAGALGEPLGRRGCGPGVARRPGRVRLGVHLAPPRVPLLGERVPEGLVGGGVQPVGNELPGHRFGEGAHAVGAVLVEEMLEEERSERVGAVAPRPDGRVAGSPPEPREAPLDRRGAHDHVVERAVDAPRLREIGLVPGGQSLRGPARYAAAREEGPRRGHAAEDGAQEAPERTGAIQVEDVRQLVRDHELHPVVEVAEAGVVHGRAGDDRDAVRGPHLRVAVGDVRVVGEEDVDAPGGRLDERPRTAPSTPVRRARRLGAPALRGRGGR